MSTSPTNARCPDDARGESAPSSANSAGFVALALTDEQRLRLLSQFRSRRFSAREHDDPFTRGWNAGIDNAIEVLFPLPIPRVTVQFPIDDVSRGLREFASNRVQSGIVQIDLSDVDTCPCTTPGCTGCAPGGFEIGGRR